MSMTKDIERSDLDAPVTFKLLAAAGLDGVGALLFAATDTGEVLLSVEEQGVWSRWGHPAWESGGPKSIVRIATCTIHSGLQFCCLNDKGELWSTSLIAKGAYWAPWEPPSSTAVWGLRTVATIQLPDTRIFWGIQEFYKSLIFSHGPPSPGQPWENWNNWPQTGLPKGYGLIEITAAQQNDGRAALWAIDTNSQLRCCYQETVAGQWTIWSPPQWNGAPGLTQIAACRQGANLGAGLWGIRRRDGLLVYTSQNSPGGNWSEWKDFSVPQGEQVSAVTATQQQNGMVRVWAVGMKSLKLWTIVQTSPSTWGQWETWPF